MRRMDFKSISHTVLSIRLTLQDTIVIYRSTYSQNADAMSRGISARSNLAETCHAMLVSTDGMSKSRHQQLLQSLPVNFCGPMVYPHKLVDHGSNHILILIDFLHPPVTWHLFPHSEFDTSSKADVYPRPPLDTWRTALPSGSIW